MRLLANNSLSWCPFDWLAAVLLGRKTTKSSKKSCREQKTECPVPQRFPLLKMEDKVGLSGLDEVMKRD